jgi:hypothetical protein
MVDESRSIEDFPSYPVARPPGVSELTKQATSEVTVTGIDVPFNSIFWFMLKVQAAGLLIALLFAPVFLLLLLIWRSVWQYLLK